MNYNSEFVDVMDNINNIGKGYGFTNGIRWAETAQNVGEITYAQSSFLIILVDGFIQVQSQ